MNNLKKELHKNQAKFLKNEESMKKLSAKDAMIKPIFILESENSNTILKKLKKEHINACVVITKEKKFIGEISDNDIISLFLNQTKFEPLVSILGRGYRREFIHKTAGEIANKHKLIANVDTPINEVIELVSSEKSEYIPVLNKNEKVVGIVTPSSLINLLINY